MHQGYRGEQAKDQQPQGAYVLVRETDNNTQNEYVFEKKTKQDKAKVVPFLSERWPLWGKQ